jgi:hypothetical protein
MAIKAEGMGMPMIFPKFVFGSRGNSGLAPILRWLAVFATLITGQDVSTQSKGIDQSYYDSQQNDGHAVTILAQGNPSNFHAENVTYPTRVGGVVSEVNNDGTFLMEGGELIHPWGIKIENIEAAADLLVGREIGCRFIYEYASIIFGDCFARERLANSAASILDLYIWIPELGWGRYECDSMNQANQSMDGTGIFFRESFGYSCIDDNTPFRSETVEENIEPTE